MSEPGRTSWQNSSLPAYGRTSRYSRPAGQSTVFVHSATLARGQPKTVRRARTKAASRCLFELSMSDAPDLNVRRGPARSTRSFRTFGLCDVVKLDDAVGKRFHGR